MQDSPTFLVPYDFSEHARAALDAAIGLAKRISGSPRILLLHVVQSPAYAYAGYADHAGVALPPAIDMTEIQEGARRSLRDAIAKQQDAPIELEPRVVEGVSIAETISREAKEIGADLIVMGTHGRTGLAHVFLGSVAERTLRTAPCPVLTVRESQDESTGGSNE